MKNLNIEYDRNGNEQKLLSPIPIEDHYFMTPMEREIEEYLYHDKEDFSSVAIVIRRALMLAKCQWERGLDSSSELQSPPPGPLGKDGDKRWEIEKFVDANEDLSEFRVRWKGYDYSKDTWEKLGDLKKNKEFNYKKFIENYQRDGPESIVYFTRSELAGQDGNIDRDKLLEGHAKFIKGKLFNKKGYTHFEPARASNEAKWDNKRTWWQKKGSQWPIFVVDKNYRATRNRGSLQNAAQKAAEGLMLNPDIIKFGRKYASQILSKPPCHTYEEIQSKCFERGLIKDDALSDVPVVEPVHFDESSGPWPLSGERQTQSQTRARDRPAGTNCQSASSGGQTVEGAQNTGKRKQVTPSRSSRSLKVSRQNDSSPTFGSSSDEDSLTPNTLDMGSVAPDQQFPASIAFTFRAGDNGASGDA